MTQIYAIGDIHGCHDLLLAVLTKIKAHAGKKPFLGIFLGDYIDRGPQSREVVNQVRALVTGRGPGKWIALKGNHEEMLVSDLAGEDYKGVWRANGGEQTLASYRDREAELKEHAEWLSSLPTWHETRHHIFVHAGLDPRLSLAEQTDEARLWIRNWQQGDPDFGKHVVYGHTRYREPQRLANSTGLDTGAFHQGTLTCGVFDESKPGGPLTLLQASMATV